MTTEQKRERFRRVVAQVRTIAPKTWCMDDEPVHVEDYLRTLEQQRETARKSIANLKAGACFQSKPFSILR